MSRVFCGREQELEGLRRAYRAIAHDESDRPQVVTLVAESGLGKTRLVQEFYRWLSTSEDRAAPDGYWPDELGADDDNLLLNPPAGACNNTRPVPFLWWGIRLPDPGARNQAVAGQLAASLEALRPHLEPAYRTRRRRRTRLDAGLAIGKVVLDLALDAAVDVIPLGGLFKTLGEGAAELGQHVRQLWHDAPPGSVQQIEAQQREDLASRVVSDLGVLLSRESGDGTAVPAVIVVDDAQFSEGDPSIVTFVDRLLAAATAGRWRVLLVVTYWAAEWNRHMASRQAGTIAGAIGTRAASLGAGWSHVELAPVDDLSPMLAMSLPGLTSSQHAALLERAGGNPRYLDEILRFCERNTRLFEGRSLASPMTARGFETAMERTVHLHDLVEERLRSLEPEVLHTLLLASLQGQEFVAPLVAEVAAVLGTASDESALARAEHPHAFVRRQSPDLGAFAQRIFHEVAAASVANEFDEEEVVHALRTVVRRRLADTPALESASPTVRIRTCLLATHVLADSPDPEDRYRIVYALARLGSEFGNLHDYESARQFLGRLVEALAPMNPANTSFYFYFLAAEHLTEQGAYGEAREMLETAIEAQQVRVDADPTGAAARDLSLLLKALGDAARLAGAPDIAEDAYRRALHIDRQTAAAGTSAHAARDLMISLLNVSRIAETRGDLAAARRDCLEGLAMARARHEDEPTETTREDLTYALVALADIEAAAGHAAAAEALYRQRLQLEPDAVDPEADPAGARRRALVLERLAGLALDAGHLDAVDALLAEARALREPAARRLGTPGALNELAGLLRTIGDAALRRDDYVAADAAFRESLAISSELAQSTATPDVLRGLSLSFERFGKVALMADDLDTATAIFEQRVVLDRHLVDACGTPADHRCFMTSCYWLADIAEQRGLLEDAERGFTDTLAIARDLAARTQTSAAREDLRPILRRLIALARRRGDAGLASAYEHELSSLR